MTIGELGHEVEYIEMYEVSSTLDRHVRRCHPIDNLRDQLEIHNYGGFTSFSPLSHLIVLKPSVKT